MSIKNLMIDICDIERKTVSQDGLGQRIENWNKLFSGIPCRFDSSPKSFRRSDTDYKIISRNHIFFIPIDYIDVDVGDRVIYRGDIYEIQDLFVFQNDAAYHHIEIYTSIKIYE